MREARLDEALVELQGKIRTRPADASLRVFLFQLYTVMGRFEKAVTQLQLAASMDPEAMMLGKIFQPLVEAEMHRREVFAGKRAPLIFGEPDPWIGMLVQAQSMLAAGDFAAAAALRTAALEAAPANPGTVDGVEIGWLADADSRFGPLTEAVIDGKYYWVPFSRVRRLTLEKPVDLRDLVWAPATFLWTNEGQVSAHVPVRYPGTETETDGAFLLARRTEFAEPFPGTFLGRGQRTWSSDVADHALLDTRVIEFSS